MDAGRMKPAHFFRRQIGEIEQHVAGDQFFVLTAGVELRRARGIATENALQRGRAGVFAAGDSSIDPLVAAQGVELTSEHRHGSLFAARRPPVNDFNVRSPHRGAAKQGGSHQGRHRHD